MKEVVEPELDRRCELVKVLVDGNWGKSGRMRSWEELPGDVRVMTQFVTERMEARELADIGSDVGATTKGRYPLIDRSGIGGPQLIPEQAVRAVLPTGRRESNRNDTPPRPRMSIHHTDPRGGTPRSPGKHDPGRSRARGSPGHGEGAASPRIPPPLHHRFPSDHGQRTDG